MTAIGPIVYSFFEQHLKAEKGLSPASVRSYRDALRLFLSFVAAERGRSLTRITVEDFTAERVRHFLVTWRRAAAITSARATSASLGFIRSSTIWRAKCRKRLPRRSASRQFPGKGRHRRQPSSSSAMRSRRSSQACRQQDTRRCATAPSCCSCTIPVLVSRKRLISGSVTWSLGPSHASICTAKATSGELAPCGQRRRGCCVSCSPSGQPSHHRLLRYSHPDKVGRSPDTGFTSLFVGMRRT